MLNGFWYEKYHLSRTFLHGEVWMNWNRYNTWPGTLEVKNIKWKIQSSENYWAIFMWQFRLTVFSGLWRVNIATKILIYTLPFGYDFAQRHWPRPVFEYVLILNCVSPSFIKSVPIVQRWCNLTHSKAFILLRTQRNVTMIHNWRYSWGEVLFLTQASVSLKWKFTQLDSFVLW